jgi:hypothetical protein
MDRIESALKWQNPHADEPGRVVYHNNVSLTAMEMVNQFCDEPIKLAAAIERSICIAYRMGKGEI